MKIYDVVIIGAGLAGLQCAKLLSRCGAKILLVDRKTDLAKGVHTTGIFVRKTLEDFDFPEGTLGKPIKEPAEKIDAEYVFCDTKEELPETYEYLKLLEAYLGKPIVHLTDDRGFKHWLQRLRRSFSYGPNACR